MRPADGRLLPAKTTMRAAQRAHATCGSKRDTITGVAERFMCMATLLTQSLRAAL